MKEAQVKGVYMYAVKDLKAGQFDVPFFARNDLFAARRFIMDIRNRKESMVHNFREDFELYRLGLFVHESGLVEVDMDLISSGKDVKVDQVNGGDDA